MNEHLTKAQLAKMLNVGQSTINLWMATRRIPYIKMGGCVRFDPVEINAVLNKHKVKAISER